MKAFNRKTGNIGEELAAKYLIKNSYQILERNFHTRFGEIDIICKKKDTIIFIEVKTKTSINYGTPEEMINQNKINKIQKMANVYLTTKRLHNYSIRLDAIAITLDGNGQVQSFNHHENLY